MDVDLPTSKRRRTEEASDEEHSDVKPPQSARTTASILALHHPNPVKKLRPFDRLAQSVLKIYATKTSYDWESPWCAPKLSSSSGSGFFISGRRIVTNAHVVSNASFLQVRKAGTARKVPARVRRVLHGVDLAILELDLPEDDTGVELGDKFFAGTKALAFGETPRVGDEVFAYGFPWGGEELSLTKGVVSRVEMNLTAHGGVGGEVLSADMDVAIAKGNSGGPVTGNLLKEGCFSDDDEVKVVGVVFQGYSTKEGGYMIAAEVLKKAVQMDDIGETLEVPASGLRCQRLENVMLRKSLGIEGEKVLDQEVHSCANPVDVCFVRKTCVKRDMGRTNCEGGILVVFVADYSPLKGVVVPGDVLLNVGPYAVAENATIELRAGERTRWTHAFATGKTVGEETEFQWFRPAMKDMMESDVMKEFEALEPETQKRGFYSAVVEMGRTGANLCHAGELLYDQKPQFVLLKCYFFQDLNTHIDFVN